MRRHIALAFLSVFAINACTIGSTARQLPVATQPGGAQITATVKGLRTYGELIAVRDDGIILSAQNKLSFVPFSLIGDMAVANLGSDYQLSPGKIPDGAKLDRLRLVSHFPQGLTPEIERQLLARAGQTEIITVQ